MDKSLFFASKSSLRARLLILVGIVIILLTIGTFFYHEVEGWSYIDSFYFSSISLATRGYGEVHPEHTISKIFTAAYLLIGVAFILYMMSGFIGYFVQYQEPILHKKVVSFKNRVSPPRKNKWVVIKSRKTEEFDPNNIR
ncbi:MAG: potassium channel family protein [Candidatus Nanoarchaeia archaeon]|nr:potassium channel family protein [Candidatus Nanoarchaeia archaeon]